MPLPGPYTMADLTSLTGVSRRQIYHWISKGAVPRPVGRTRAATYNDDHLRRIRTVLREVYDNRVTLGDLAERFNPETNDE